MLGYLAFTLDQAGAYIRKLNLPLHNFASHYKRRKRKIFDEVPEQWEYHRKLGETEKETILNVLVTWELSLEQLNGNAEAKEGKEYFLTLAGHFDNKCISQRYFEAYYKAEYAAWMQTCTIDGEWDEYKYRDLVAECRKLSLVQALDRQVDGVQFSLYPVVRDWLKVRIKQKKHEVYSRDFTNLLTCYAKGVRFDDLDLQVKQETLLHMDACL